MKTHLVEEIFLPQRCTHDAVTMHSRRNHDAVTTQLSVFKNPSKIHHYLLPKNKNYDEQCQSSFFR